MSAHADGEQHVALRESLDRVGYSRIQHESLAGSQSMLCRTCLHGQFTPKTMNHYMPGSLMLRQAAA